MADNYLCRECHKTPAATKNNCYRTHYADTEGNPRCETSGEPIPEDLLDQGPIGKGTPPEVPVEGQDFATCKECGRKVKLTNLGYFPPHDTTLKGGEECQVKGVRAVYPPKAEGEPLPADGVVRETDLSGEITSTAPTPESAGAGSSPTEPPLTSGATEPATQTPAGVQIDWSKVGLKPGQLVTASALSTPTPEISSEPSTQSGPETITSSDAPEETAEPAPISLGVTVNALFLQPFSPFLQPGAPQLPASVEGLTGSATFLQPPEYGGPVKAEPMGDLARDLATKIKETFYAYSNRKTSDNRSAQTTLGPSEIGTPCDRRLAMALLDVAPVNAGGDGWAAFVGTCTHVGMAEVYTFADAGTGRYAVELPVFLGMPTVPRGTTDLLDRRDGTVIDWKVMGKYSLDKFKKEGPTATYRTQAHVYGLGAERGGEKVRNVAVVGLPRAGFSLDEMHIWTEKFDRKFAQAALDRVERIANEISVMSGQAAAGEIDGPNGPMEAAATFDTADKEACRFCPHFLKGDKAMVRGCPGVEG